MGAIDEYVKAFARDRHEYQEIEARLASQIRELCEKSLRSNDYLWQSRVKEVASLEQKLRGREKNYDNESANIKDIKDLVGGRIILARHVDVATVEEIIGRTFTILDRNQHPKLDLRREQRFRGYDGLHFHVTMREHRIEKYCNITIEIQIMSAFMWAFTALEHDIEYKQLHGESTSGVKSCLEQLKGIANLGELTIQQFEVAFHPGFHKLLSKSQSYGNANGKPESQDAIRTLIYESASKFDVLDKKDRQCLHDLRVTDPRDDKSRIEASNDRLVEGSCSWVCKDSAFVRWWNNDDCNFLWIHGDPGKGKTTIMITLISEITKRLENCAGSNVITYFFCQSTSAELSSTVSVLRGLIFLLIDQEKTLNRHLRKSYDSAGRKMFEGQNAYHALQRVLIDILKDTRLQSICIMIDALDECDEQILKLLDWIIRNDCDIPKKVKWLVTSRNEPSFTERLGCNRRLDISLEHNSMHVAYAVDRFIAYKVQELAQLKNYGLDLRQYVRQRLESNADGTFLWVALVCKELLDVKVYRVRSLLQETPNSLKALYRRMFHQAVHRKDPVEALLCRQILCIVTLGFRPLAVDEIAILADLPEQFYEEQTIEEIVSLCGSFLVVRSRMVYFVHQSARDFFTVGEGKTIFDKGEEYGHSQLARLCLGLMSDGLKQDICLFKMPGVLYSRLLNVDRFIPLHLQYACHFWQQHSVAGNFHELSSAILDFLKEHLLHWLEALSFMQILIEGAFALSSVEFMTGDGKKPELRSFVVDAEIFLDKFINVIDKAPLQVYDSALILSSQKSIIRQHFTNLLPTWIEHVVESDHTSEVTVVLISSAGGTVASASTDGSIRLWDSTTSALRKVLRAHADAVTSMAYSTNGQVLVSGSRDLSIKVWDLVHQVCKGVLWGHLDAVTMTAFSSDDLVLVSVSTDGTARIWDVVAMKEEGRLDGLMQGVASLAFSPSNALLAVGCRDCCVRLWSPVTKAPQGSLRGPTTQNSHCVRVVVFSSNGQRLAAACDDRVILWSIRDENILQVIHQSYCCQLSFGHDQSYLNVDGSNYKIPTDASDSGSSIQASASLVYSIGIQLSWIHFNGRPFLLLPQRYLGDRYSVHDNVLTIAIDQGGLVFLRFSKKNLPPDAGFPFRAGLAFRVPSLL